MQLHRGLLTLLRLDAPPRTRPLYRGGPPPLDWAPPGASTYPSGYAALSVVLLMALAYIVQRLSARRWIDVVTPGVAVLLIGLSRLYLAP